MPTAHAPLPKRILYLPTRMVVALPLSKTGRACAPRRSYTWLESTESCGVPCMHGVILHQHGVYCRLQQAGVTPPPLPGGAAAGRSCRPGSSPLLAAASWPAFEWATLLSVTKALGRHLHNSLGQATDLVAL